MLRSVSRQLHLLVLFAVLIPVLEAPGQAKEYQSFMEAQPAFPYMLLRYRKYYGDPFTINGNLGERSYLTGNWGGLRDRMAENGLFTSFAVTQFGGGVIDGGNEHVFRANGSADYTIMLDTGKAKLWSGGIVFVHGETSWAKSMNRDTGALIPASYDALNPDQDVPNTALSEFYLVQALGEKTSFLVGKSDLASFADCNLFANQWRYQFASTGMVNNPQLGTIVPYTTHAFWLLQQLSKRLTLVYSLNAADSRATTSSFDTIFNGNMVNSLLLIADTSIGDKPGMLHILGNYTSSELPNFAIDSKQAVETILGQVPIEQVDGNYGVYFSGSQYVQTWDSGHREGCKYAPSRPLGWGVFWRYGVTPQDRNVISQYASFGIGGYGGPFGRIYDNWGVGWSGSYMSPDLRNAAELIEDVQPWEHNVEAYYNYRITPSTHLSFHVLTSDPAIRRIESPASLGMRLQIDL